ncbi:MAG: 16S rRNA (uracil(1498)-N(3))-methyltransferase, partial [Planctomycetota bacterium]|nr:16S rRNA (uracil(1498)-N(3))-methyltransferase [Planctomycetota bacterium]
MDSAAGAGRVSVMSAHDSPRFWAPGLAAGALALDEAQAHYALHVLRLKPGAAVELFDGLGLRARGRIDQATRREVVLAVEELLPPSPPPRPAIHLAFAVPKGKRLDWLLEKATELGAASLQGVGNGFAPVDVTAAPVLARTWWTDKTPAPSPTGA